MSNTPAHLARNITTLRDARGLTQSALAKKAGIPRSTLTHLEGGAGNPSLSNLLAVAGALGVNVEELLTKPRRSVLYIQASEVPVSHLANGKAKVSRLLPDKIRGMHFDMMALDAGATLTGQPHLRGTKEYLTVLEGEITVIASGEPYALRKGDVLAFEGDQAHAYRNPSTRKAVALSVVIPFV